MRTRVTRAEAHYISAAGGSLYETFHKGGKISGASRSAGCGIGQDPRAGTLQFIVPSLCIFHHISFLPVSGDNGEEEEKFNPRFMRFGSQ
jgi:hypothetical protein